MLRHRCPVDRRPAERPRRNSDRNFGHFTIGASLGQLIGPVAAGLAHLRPRRRGWPATSATALLVSGAVAAVSYASLWRIEQRARRRAAGRRGPYAPDRRVPVRGILRTRGVPAGIFISLAVLSATDILTAYLPVVGEDRAIAPATIGLLLSLRAAATIACRLVMTPMIRLAGPHRADGRQLRAGRACCAAVWLLPVPGVGAGARAARALGFCLGVGQPLSMTTVVQAAPDRARSTALALRLTGNRLGQVAAPAGAGLLAGVAGTAAPFVMLGVLLLASAGWRPVRGRRGAARTCRHGARGADGRRGPGKAGYRSVQRRKCRPSAEGGTATDRPEARGDRHRPAIRGADPWRAQNYRR